MEFDPVPSLSTRPYIDDTLMNTTCGCHTDTRNGAGNPFLVAFNDTSLESRCFVTCVDKLLYFNIHQFLLKRDEYFGSDRRISDLIGLFRRNVTK